MNKRERFDLNCRRGLVKAGTVETTQINYSGYGYGRHNAGMTHVYYFNGESVEDLGVMTHHRAKVVISMIERGTWFNVDEDLRKNYTTNGFNTRVGLVKANINRVKTIAQSHKSLPFSGQAAHQLRKIKRN